MLYEIYCDKFTTKKDGQFVPRGRIRLHEGLNTVLGDKAAQNSIGKSTFLLIVDFCFGGEDYINPKICKAKEKLHSHTINFAFKFGDRIDYFCRRTDTPSEVGICNSQYEILRTQSLTEFKNYLLIAYDIKTPFISFREMVGRFLRIYGRENYPDFLAKMNDGSYQLIEVKGDNMIDDEVVKAKAEAAEEMSVASGMKYVMYAGSVLMKQNVLEHPPVTYSDEPSPLLMVAEDPVPYGK